MGTIRGTLVFIFQNEHVLLIYGKKKGTPRTGTWNGLGGKFAEIDEDDPLKCARREVFAECGLYDLELKYGGTATFFSDSSDDVWQVEVYRCHRFSGELKASDEGQIQFWPLNMIHLLMLTPGTQEILSFLSSSSPFNVHFTLEQGHVTNIQGVVGVSE